MPTPCEALATAAEVQELREQLNALLGEKEDGTKVSLFAKGQGNTTLLAGGALTLLGMAKVNAPKVIVDIIKSTPTPQGFAVDAAKGQVLHELLKGNGTKVPATPLNDTTKLAGQGAGAATTATQVGGTAAGSLMLLATLVQIAGTLALNKATVDILGNRIDAEAAGTQTALDTQQNTMLRLYQKHQGDFAAINAQLEANDQVAAQNRQTFAILKSDLQQNSLEIGTFNSKLTAAQTQINDLITQNNSHVAKINQLEDDLVTVKADLTAQVNTVTSQLAEAVKIIEAQKIDIEKTNERVAEYEARATAIEEKIAQFETDSAQNRADWQELRAEIDLIKELNPSLITERPTIEEHNYDKVTYYETAEQTYERLFKEHNKPADQRKAWSQITQFELTSELAERFARQEIQAKKHGFASTAGLTQSAAVQTGVLELADKLGDPTLEPSTIPKEITKEDLQNDPDTFKERFAAFIERITPNVSPKLLEDINTKIDDRFDAISTIIGTAVIPRLNDLTSSVSEPKIAKAVEAGLCNSLNNPSACPITPGNPNPTQGLKGQQDWLNGLLNGADLAQGTVMAKAIDRIDKTVHHKDWGLETVQKFADTAWKATQADKVLQVVNTTLLIHNAMMLSNNLFQTMGEATSMALQAVGITDHANQPIDVNTLVQGKINAMLSSVLGAANYKALTARIAKANRIYQSGINILDATRNMFDATHSIGEVTLRHTGEIGNALRNAGVVAEDSYQEMVEKVNPASKRLMGLEKFRAGIDVAEEAFDSVSQVSGNVLEIQQNIAEIKTSKTAMIKEMETDKTAKKAAEVITKQESQVTANPAKADFEAAPPKTSP
jgi:hypothetical protein